MFEQINKKKFSWCPDKLNDSGNNFERVSGKCKSLFPAKKWYDERQAEKIMTFSKKRFIYLGRKDHRVLLGFYTTPEQMQKDETIKEPSSEQKKLIRIELINNDF